MIKKLEKSIFYLLPQNSDFARYNVTFVLNILTLTSRGRYGGGGGGGAGGLILERELITESDL